MGFDYTENPTQIKSFSVESEELFLMMQAYTAKTRRDMKDKEMYEENKSKFSQLINACNGNNKQIVFKLVHGKEKIHTANKED